MRRSAVLANLMFLIYGVSHVQVDTVDVDVPARALHPLARSGWMDTASATELTAAAAPLVDLTGDDGHQEVIPDEAINSRLKRVVG